MTDYVCVIGLAAVDIGGFPYNELVPEDSNPGEVRISYGGVARNIASRFAGLYQGTRFLGFVGDDDFGTRIITHMSEQGVDMNYICRPKDSKTPTYLYINDTNEDMALAVFSSEAEKYLTVENLRDKLPMINAGRALIMDTNPSPQVLEFLAANVTVPIFLDPVSTRKAEKIKNVLDKLYCIKPNRIEAEALSGVAITDIESAKLSARELISKGVKNVFISLGSEGVIAANADVCEHISRSFDFAKSRTGAGDTFLAGVVASYINGNDIITQAKEGLSYVMQIFGS